MRGNAARGLIGWVSHDAKIVVLPALAAGAEVRRACAQRLAAESTPLGCSKRSPAQRGTLDGAYAVSANADNTEL